MSLQSNNMKSGELQKRGQKFYRHKEYRAALECFNAEDQHLLVTLDNRAATLTKLGDLQAALKDARLMIKKDKTNHTVHLPHLYL
ncbi:hypothetical protein MMC12_000534 [Toensbergia leucococca]|nr:hypothetical protein [Toensbergia leucococca]